MLETVHNFRHYLCCTCQLEGLKLDSFAILLNCKELVFTHIHTELATLYCIIYLEWRRWLHTIVTQLEAHAAIIKFSHHEYSQPLSLPHMKCVGVENRKWGNLEIACDSLNSWLCCFWEFSNSVSDILGHFSNS